MRIFAVFTLLLWVAPAFAEDTVQQLEQDLTAAPSATQFLTDKCASLKLASPAAIKARRERLLLPASRETRLALGVDANTPLGYRRVLLSCGVHVLSEADNWYVPGRLTPQMNQTLDASDTPFGAVVKPLDFHRKTLKMEALHDRMHVLQVTAVLISGEGKPFSLVVENYSRELTGNR